MAVEVPAQEQSPPPLSADDRLELEEQEELDRLGLDTEEGGQPPPPSETPIGDQQEEQGSEQQEQEETPDDLQTLKDQLAETRAELAYVRGALSGGPRQPETRPPSEPDEPVIDPAKLVSRLRTDPIGVIQEIAETVAQKTEKRVRNEVGRMSQYERAMAIDREQTDSVFGEMGQDPEVVVIRDQILTNVKKEIGNLYPGAHLMATGTAISIVQRQRANAANGGGNGAPPKAVSKATLPVRRPADTVRGTQPAKGVKDATAPVKFEELPKEDQKGIQLFCSRTKMPVSKYMERLNQRRRENPEYGTGR